MQSAGWQARLSLHFARQADRTALARREHSGPLVVQKPLYPEGPAVCQCIIVHPPGGIAGGDDLVLEVEAGAGSHVQLTTPGAAKWYRSSGRVATQRLEFNVGDAAVFEWLPQATIVFAGARARSTLNLHIAPAATFCGWDIVCLGRTASSERFASGEWRQRIEITRGVALLWSERGVVSQASAMLSSPVGLNDAPVFGTFVLVAPVIADALVSAARSCNPGDGEGAVTRLPGLLVVRYRGHSAESAFDYFVAIWSLLRPALIGRAAYPPRIWRT